MPTLVVVSGPAGAGKTTLAHALASAVGAPAICRDELKEGMVHSHPGFQPHPGDPLTMRTYTLYFDVLELLLSAGVTVVAEAAFQDHLWRPGLERLTGLARLRILHCTVDAAVARERVTRRLTDQPASRSAHADGDLLRELDRRRSDFEPVSLPVPSIRVDTTDGYTPGIPELVAFVNQST